MGEHILRVALGEITHVRVGCKQCGTVQEVPLKELGHIRNSCHCGRTFVRDRESGASRFEALGEAIEALAGMDDCYDVEFPVRLDDAGK